MQSGRLLPQLQRFDGTHEARKVGWCQQCRMETLNVERCWDVEMFSENSHLINFLLLIIPYLERCEFSLVSYVLNNRSWTLMVNQPIQTDQRNLPMVNPNGISEMTSTFRLLGLVSTSIYPFSVVRFLCKWSTVIFLGVLGVFFRHFRWGFSLWRWSVLKRIRTSLM